MLKIRKMSMVFQWVGEREGGAAANGYAIGGWGDNTCIQMGEAIKIKK